MSSFNIVYKGGFLVERSLAQHNLINLYLYKFNGFNF